MFETFLQLSFLLFLVDIKVYMFVFLQSRGGRDYEGPAWGGKGGEEREREGGSRNVFVKKWLMTQKNSV